MKKLSHLDSRGQARMVDVGAKPVTPRRAVASCFVRLGPETRNLLAEGELRKGDALAVARLAGIQGAKSTPALLPLCHPLPLDQVRVAFREEEGGLRILVEARVQARTGVEMEALTGAAVAGLAVIDMVKSTERGVTVEALRLELKEGGKSGRWARPDFEEPWKEEDEGEGNAPR
jgi:cyclic pyranopterin phosphate synthase